MGVGLIGAGDAVIVLGVAVGKLVCQGAPVVVIIGSLILACYGVSRDELVVCVDGELLA